MSCDPNTFNKQDYNSGDGMLTSVWDRRFGIQSTQCHLITR